MGALASAIQVAPAAAVSGLVAGAFYHWAEKECKKEGGNPDHPAAKIINAVTATSAGGVTYAPFVAQRYLRNPSEFAASSMKNFAPKAVTRSAASAGGYLAAEQLAKTFFHTPSRPA